MTAKNNKKSRKSAKPAAREKRKGAGSTAKKTTHPRSSEMVRDALASLKEKKGTSLQAIKNYISSTYRVDMSKQSSHIKKYIKSAVESNEIVRTKGTGVSGRFRLPTVTDLRKEKQKSMPKKPPAKKEAPVKPSSATKKKAAHQKSDGKGKAKNSVVKKAAKQKELKKLKSAKNSKK